MATLYFDENDRLDTIINRVRESPDPELTLFIPEGSVFYQNELNKKILQKVAGETGKTVRFGDEEKNREQLQSSQPSSPSQPKPPIPPNPSPKRISKLKIFVILIGIFGVFAVSAAAFVLLYLPKATVVLFVEEKILQGEETIEISPDITEISFAEKKIPGKVLAVTEEEKKNFSATGKKTVGEKATGTATLLNWTKEEERIPRGTKLAVALDEKEGLVFWTEEPAVIPVAQTGTDPRIREPGEVGVPIIADDIGKRYNLDANTQFIIDGFDPYYELSAFCEPPGSAGGLTSEMIVVSQEDQNKAQEELKAKLLAQGKEDLQSKVLGDQKLLEEVITGNVLGTNFSHEIGDEVGSFEVALKTQSTATVYSESQLKELAGKILGDNIPEGYKISSKDLGVAIGSIERKAGGNLSLTGTFKTLVIPAFSEASLIEELSGKRALVAGEIIENIPYVQGWNITFWPRMPIFLQILPLNSERINIKIETQK